MLLVALPIGGISMATPLTDEALSGLIDELDRGIPREGAKVQLFSDSDGTEGGILGNRLGYLRLGVEMLKAATATQLHDSQSKLGNIDADVSYIVDPDSAFQFQWFARKEEIKPILSVPPTWGNWVAMLVIAVMLGTIGLAVVGLLSIVR